MKIRREFKIGVFAVIVLLVSWWGIKWLGGQNLLKNSNIYYVYFDDVTGLMESSRVQLRGVEVGNVRSITLEEERVKVEIAIESRYADMIADNSVAEIGSSGLMGSTKVFIIQGDSDKIMKDGATFEGRQRPDIMGMLADKGGVLMDGLNKTVQGINELLAGNSANITSLIANLESLSTSIDTLLSSSAAGIEGAVNNLNTFTSSLAANTERIESVIDNVDKFSGELADADVVNKLTTTVASLNEVIAAIESGEGSAGKLIYDAALYNSLSEAGNNLAVLLEDLKEHPMRYVHFSLFGQDEDKAAKKAAKRAEREARRNN